eukprot:CAMPEP_0169340594 /NCGR_PEP_ID=MMETSP1017-20121227/19042_1 /TAXON_ID=342587 /ORGANISM="Karlodinium micrum, Strain CCMP2283" /LENGTH=855 /DNA_ID=CAMNT_0009436225 /DNA_START=127 /DNA_END=2691 /DNA_ORIENTATION=-
MDVEAILSVLNSVECRVNNISTEMTAEGERQKAITANVSERLEAVASVVDKVVSDTMHATKTAAQALALASNLSRSNDGCPPPSRDQDVVLEAKFKAFEGYCEEMISSQCSVHREQILKVTHSMNAMGKEFMKDVDRFGAELADHSEQFKDFRSETKRCLQELPSDNLHELSENVRTLGERTSVIEFILKRLTQRIALFDGLVAQYEDASGEAARSPPVLAGSAPETNEAIGIGSRVEAEYRDSWYKGTVVKLPEDDREGKRRYGVQCDVDDEGRLTYTNKVRLKEFETSMTVAEGLEDHISSTCSGSTKEGQRLKRSDSSPTTNDSMPERGYDTVPSVGSELSPLASMTLVPHFPVGSGGSSRPVPTLPLAATLNASHSESSICHERGGYRGSDKPEPVFSFAAHAKMVQEIEVASRQMARNTSVPSLRKADANQSMNRNADERVRSHSPVGGVRRGLHQYGKPLEQPATTCLPLGRSLAMAARGRCGLTSAVSTETTSPPASPVSPPLSPPSLAPRGPVQEPSQRSTEHEQLSKHCVDAMAETELVLRSGEVVTHQQVPLVEPASFAPVLEIDTATDLPSTASARSVSPSTQGSMRVSPGRHPGTGFPVVAARFIERVPSEVRSRPSHTDEQVAPSRERSLSSAATVQPPDEVSIPRWTALEGLESVRTPPGVEKRPSSPPLGYRIPDSNAGRVGTSAVASSAQSDVLRASSIARRPISPVRRTPSLSLQGLTELSAPPPQVSAVASNIDGRSPSPFRSDGPLTSACAKVGATLAAPVQKQPSEVPQRAQAVGSANVPNASPTRRLSPDRIWTASATGGSTRPSGPSRCGPARSAPTETQRFVHDHAQWTASS